MISLLAIALTLCSGPAPSWTDPRATDPLAAAVTAAGPLPHGESPHPAVVRVIAPLPDGFSLGSGTLVGASRHYGLVVTNWHVVRDASGLITVVFPDGFRSGARVLKTDRNWDLAALAIWKAKAEPVPISPYLPRPGDPLTIAGYGAGWYRAAAGRCVEYVSPGDNFPPEMVELSAGARQGDSGGPIFNRRGELAGVLFGAAMGHTTGSYGGRVREFLGSVVDDMQRADPKETMSKETMIAQQPPPSQREPRSSAPPRMPAVTSRPRPVLASIADSPAPPAPPRLPRPSPLPPPPSPPAPIPAVSAAPPPSAFRLPPSPLGPAEEQVGDCPDFRAAKMGLSPCEVREPAAPPAWSEILGTTTAEQAKTILAGIGLLFVIVFALRTLAALQPRPAPKRRR